MRSNNRVICVLIVPQSSNILKQRNKLDPTILYVSYILFASVTVCVTVQRLQMLCMYPYYYLLYARYHLISYICLNCAKIMNTGPGQSLCAMNIKLICCRMAMLYQA